MFIVERIAFEKIMVFISNLGTIT